MHHQCLFAFGLLLVLMPESKLIMQILEKKDHYFHSSNKVLLRETLLATADDEPT